MYPCPKEIAVDLVNLNYGRQLIGHATEEAGIQHRASAIPKAGTDSAVHSILYAFRSDTE